MVTDFGVHAGCCFFKFSRKRIYKYFDCTTHASARNLSSAISEGRPLRLRERISAACQIAVERSAIWRVTLSSHLYEQLYPHLGVYDHGRP